MVTIISEIMSKESMIFVYFNHINTCYSKLAVKSEIKLQISDSIKNGTFRLICYRSAFTTFKICMSFVIKMLCLT